MHERVGRRVVELAHRLAKALQLSGRERLEGLRGLDERGRRGYRFQQGEVAVALERRKRVGPRGGAVGLECGESRAQAVCVDLFQGGALLAQVRLEHVEIAERTERASQPVELLAHGLRPHGVQHRTGRAEQRTQPSGRDPDVVHRLRVGAEPDTRVGGEQVEVSLGDVDADALGVGLRRAA